MPSPAFPSRSARRNGCCAARRGEVRVSRRCAGAGSGWPGVRGVAGHGSRPRSDTGRSSGALARARRAPPDHRRRRCRPRSRRRSGARSRAGRTRSWTSVIARSRSSCAARTPNGCSLPRARCRSMRGLPGRRLHAHRVREGRDRAVAHQAGRVSRRGRALLLPLCRRPARRGRARAAGIDAGCRRSVLTWCTAVVPGVPTAEVRNEPLEDSCGLAPPGRRTALRNRAFHRRRARRRARRSFHGRESREHRAALRGRVRYRGGHRPGGCFGSPRLCGRPLALHGAPGPSRRTQHGWPGSSSATPIGSHCSIRSRWASRSATCSRSTCRSRR